MKLFQIEVEDDITLAYVFAKDENTARKMVEKSENDNGDLGLDGMKFTVREVTKPKIIIEAGE